MPDRLVSMQLLAGFRVALGWVFAPLVLIVAIVERCLAVQAACA